ncbi:MAG TPA: hypothetical protein IAC03_03435 [Candidatus Coprenecus pullistercoris]|nr:hypothetical protein [Candidatus Coprenecus pullistercoris]
MSERKRPAVQPLHLVIEKVDGPLFMVRSRKYSVTVKLQDQDKIDAGRVVYELYDDGNNLIASEKSPSLIIPQSRSGVYSVIVKDTETGYRSGPYKITGCRIQRVEKGRLEHICNSGDYNIMGKTEAYAFSPSLTLEFSGISGEEDKAASIDDICTRISLGIWSSVSVMDIRYDDLNRVEYVKFKVEE